jgi:transglutaminase-like putative cysteine protease
MSHQKLIVERHDQERLVAHVEPLLHGEDGNVQALWYMAKWVREDQADLGLEQYAADLVRRVRGHDYDGEVTALFEYTRDKIVYRKDPIGIERIRDARRTIQLGYGDCADKVETLCTLLANLGHKSRFVVLGYRPTAYQHVYADVQMSNGLWKPHDPTPENFKPGDEGKGMRKGIYEIFR